ncbi:hypothetical protein RIVM261_007460 [Rivularia sp. IAM M-261]|nr:hypothetical protein CAL7716_064280 [Calothrix sp. PCC 7716]GJD15790.1 hypothetical protein RIVM261_007460 [Rivularia sp. IAM M-261]
MTNKQSWLYKLLVCSLISTHQPAQAQITPDNTLGAEGSRLTPNILINGASSDRIDGGAVRGSNLFHSFTEFNIKLATQQQIVEIAEISILLLGISQLLEMEET